MNAQNAALPINLTKNTQLLVHELNPGLNTNRFLYPFELDSSVKIFTTLKPFIGTLFDIPRFKKKNFIVRKIFKENLIIIQDSATKFNLTIDPVFNFQFGRDLSDSLGTNLYTNTRGVIVRGNVGAKFSFESSFYESQSTFPNYLKQFANTYKVVPGQGRWKNFKLTGYDYAFSSGIINFSPTPTLHFQVGNGKLFIGDGYRSLFLSDNAFNYPYLRISKQFKIIQYTAIYAQLMNFSFGNVQTPANTEPLFQKKAASFQFLDIAITKFWNVGLFQSLLWEAADKNNKQNLHLTYLNPIPLTNPLLFGLNSTNNTSIGFSTKIKLAKQVVIYGQYYIDALPENNFKTSINNKTGYQAGAYWLNALSLKNLTFQLEYNSVRPYTYSHKKTEQSYTHYNQPLAHPLQSNFTELVALASYNYKRWGISIKYNYIQIGRDSIGRNYGNSIFASNNDAYYGVNSTSNELLQGIKTSVSIVDVKAHFILKAPTGAKLFMGYFVRNETSTTSSLYTKYFYVGFKTNMCNFYSDF
ncbi:MAG: hypothetical protein J0M08_05010 [Bacteroidetes bacterium]|nr:hypothetical protein [Bacteroidota bacterium]